MLSHACGRELGTNTGNPSSQTALKFAGIDSSLTTKLRTKALPGGIDITEARLVLEAIDFKSAEDCDNDDETETEIDFEGPFVVDLLSNMSIPETTNISIPAGNYCRIRLRLDELDDDERPNGIDASDSIIDKSVLIVGTRSDATPFYDCNREK